MPYEGYMQDLSQLINDCLLHVSDTNGGLIDDSSHDAKPPASIDLTTSTFEDMLELDKAVDLESEAGKATSEPESTRSPFTSTDSDWEEINSISTSTHNLASPIFFNHHPAIITPPLVITPPVKKGDLPPMASPTSPEKVPLVSITNIPPTLTPSSTRIVQADEKVLLDTSVSASATEDTSVATTLPTRKTDQVIADLKDQKSAVSASSSSNLSLKARLASYASANSEPTISDLPEASVRSGDNVNTGDDGSLGEDANTESSDEEMHPTAKPRKITERKRRLNAIADSYMQERTQKRLKEGNKARPEDEAQQSARWLVNQSENREIISSPREYQVELFEKAKEKNIIAVLDTGTYRSFKLLFFSLTISGSGKTLIAVLLLRHIFAQELEDRAIGKPKRISFFLVDSVQLVFQQHAVLKANLDQPMNMFCGDMGCDLWSKKLWEKHFAENMVIVCTAEVLRQCLHHSFISMEQINLLIFDEAHHAKKDHAYARIIKDFYAQEKHVVLPKIFGMTASPVDARVDVKKAAAELEAILHCQIATAADSSLLQYTVTSKQEQLAKYAVLGPKFETPLYKEIYARFKSNSVLNKPLLYAYEASRELGSWCSDHIWPYVLDEEETKKLQAKTERKYHARKVQEPLAVLDKHKEQLREAREIVRTWPFDPPNYDPQTRTSTNMSSKVITLVTYLKERFERPTDDKCIVFVRQRYTAQLLANLFAHPQIGTPYLFAGALVSHVLLQTNYSNQNRSELEVEMLVT